MRLVLVGPPGAGKGTQATFIAQQRGIPHVSTGAIFRDHVSAGTELGALANSFMTKGDLIPDEVTNAAVKQRLADPDCANGFLLDGFPRNVTQAEVLDEMLTELGVKLDVVLELVVDEDEVIRRLSGRRTCRTCGRNWHVDFDPPAKDGICDVDGGELFQRDDDQPETILNRLRIYAQETAPIINFYAARGLLVGIDATGPVDDITERALEALRRVED